MRRYSDEELLNAVQEFVNKEESALSADFDSHEDYPSIKTVQNRFGSWRETLDKIEVPWYLRGEYTDEDILQSIRDFVESEESLDFDQYHSHPDYPSNSAVVDRFNSWGEALRLAFPNGLEELGECPKCGGLFSSPSAHWRKSSCEPPSLTDRQKEILIGVLMGDGSISLSSRDSSVQYQLWMINKDFLTWFSKQLYPLGGNLRKEDDMWVVSLYTTPFIHELREKWYPNGEKRFPDGLELTKEMVRMWYVCDGGLVWDEDRCYGACIVSWNEKDRIDFICNLFRDLGLEPRHNSGNQAYVFPVDEFLDFIGSPPPGFEYKWESDSRVEYERLKESRLRVKRE